MNTWIRKVGMGALALTLAGVLGGCNNGNGGGLIKLFFGINGSGSCTSVTVEVNLDEANAVIARDDNGAVQCVLNTVLDNQGCDITFVELENGDLRATIFGCTIPAVTNLFSCLFESVDIDELQDTASAICACQTQGCDGTPPVCISENEDPRSCEDCDNGQDDDGNGLIDCDDPNCENAPECIDTTTTTSTSTSNTVTSTSTTTSTTTSTSTTSTTLDNFPFTCRIVFRLADDVTAGSLQFDTDYSNAPGFFLGTGGNVECATLIEGSLAAFNDVEADENLDSGIISLTGFTGPVNVSECTFKASVVPVKADFIVTVTEASDPNLNEIFPTPDVIIQQIDCSGVEPTTTTLDTTTTTVDTTTTTLTNTAANYTVKYRLLSASAGVGALQWSTNYSGAPPTGFQGTAAAVTCSNLVAGALFAPNDNEIQTKLTLGVIALSEFTAPTDLAQCTYNAFTGDPPVAGDFPVVIEDSTDGNGDPITATIGVTVTLIP